MNSRNIFIWVGGIITTIFLLYIAYSFTNTPQKTDFPEINQLRKNDHAKWSSANKNLLVEYSDLQCPACKNFNDLFKTLEASSSPDFAITKKITLIFRHFPLYQIHKNAFDAGYAAEAAANQGKFWEFIDSLYGKQTRWSESANSSDYFLTVAKELKMDIDKFKKDINSQAVKDRVQRDLDEGNKIGVNATPTFFLNGKKIEVNSVDEFKNLLKSL